MPDSLVTSSCVSYSPIVRSTLWRPRWNHTFRWGTPHGVLRHGAPFGAPTTTVWRHRKNRGRKNVKSGKTDAYTPLLVLLYSFIRQFDFNFLFVSSLYVIRIYCNFSFPIRYSKKKFVHSLFPYHLSIIIILHRYSQLLLPFYFNKNFILPLTLFYHYTTDRRQSNTRTNLNKIYPTDDSVSPFCLKFFKQLTTNE